MLIVNHFWYDLAMSERPYLSYYEEKGIIPVRQNTRELQVHLDRRQALYRHLGIQPLTLKGRRILEFGPGTGDNAQYIASCEPELYVLVDGNAASVKAISDKLQRGLLPSDRVEIQLSEITAYRDTRRFDVVLCEGVIPGQRDPGAFLAHVASFAGSDGLVVITAMSPIGLLAEACRRIVKAAFASRIHNQDDLLRSLVTFFEPDLLSLPGMSRLHEDWVLDNILHPWPMQCTFTIPEAIAALDGAFDLLGTSPSFIQDWRWYKAIPKANRTWNDVAREEYERWSGYFLDYRVNPVNSTASFGARLEHLCALALDCQHRIWRENGIEDIPRFLQHLAGIRETVAGGLPGTAASITGFMQGILDLSAGNKDADFGAFRYWFGRGQQYVSFVRKHSK